MQRLNPQVRGVFYIEVGEDIVGGRAGSQAWHFIAASWACPAVKVVSQLVNIRLVAFVVAHHVVSYRSEDERAKIELPNIKTEVETHGDLRDRVSNIRTIIGIDHTILVDVDKAQAFDLLTKAAEGGHPRTPYTLAIMYRDGDAPGGQNLSKAIEWFDVGLSRGDATSAANAAYYLMTAQIDGYDQFDAAVMGAKGATLTNRYGADAALQQVQSMPTKVLDGGTQRLMQSMGAEIEVDGAFGPGSQQALNALLAANGMEAAPTDPQARLLAIAALYWKLSPFRIDLL